jgi:hypothetical protein
MRSLKWLAIFIVLTTPALLSDRALPTPASVFGFEPGADNKLATYDQTVSYFKQVDAASDRVRLVEAGTSTQGRHRPTSGDSTGCARSHGGSRIQTACRTTRRGAWRVRANRSSTSTADCTRQR